MVQLIRSEGWSLTSCWCLSSRGHPVTGSVSCHRRQGYRSEVPRRVRSVPAYFPHCDPHVAEIPVIHERVRCRLPRSPVHLDGAGPCSGYHPRLPTWQCCRPGSSQEYEVWRASRLLLGGRDHCRLGYPLRAADLLHPQRASPQHVGLLTAMRSWACPRRCRSHVRRVHRYPRQLRDAAARHQRSECHP